jgi:transposase
VLNGIRRSRRRRKRKRKRKRKIGREAYMQEVKKLNKIFNFVVKISTVFVLGAITVLLILNSNQFGEGTTAAMITLIVGALGVSLGYRPKEEPHSALVNK